MGTQCLRAGPSLHPSAHGLADLPLHAAAYKVYDFELVTRLDGRRIPAGSGHDFKISFYRHAIAREFQPLNQCRQGQAFRHLTKFTV